MARVDHKVFLWIQTITRDTTKLVRRRLWLLELEPGIIHCAELRHYVGNVVWLLNTEDNHSISWYDEVSIITLKFLGTTCMSQQPPY